MITHKMLADDAIAVVEPSGPLSAEDLESLTKSVDTYLESHDCLKGLLIHTQQFTGWEDLDGLMHHFKFVKDHHRKIRKVALVTDSKLVSIAPRLASHFIAAEVRSFDYDSYDDALAWVRSE